MSLWETRESNAAVSLTELFDGQHDIGTLVDFDIGGCQMVCVNA